jgi:hypothetical protein
MSRGAETLLKTRLRFEEKEAEVRAARAEEAPLQPQINPTSYTLADRYYSQCEFAAPDTAAPQTDVDVFQRLSSPYHKGTGAGGGGASRRTLLSAQPPRRSASALRPARRAASPAGPSRASSAPRGGQPQTEPLLRRVRMDQYGRQANRLNMSGEGGGHSPGSERGAGGAASRRVVEAPTPPRDRDRHAALLRRAEATAGRQRNVAELRRRRGEHGGRPAPQLAAAKPCAPPSVERASPN